MVLEEMRDQKVTQDHQVRLDVPDYPGAVVLPVILEKQDSPDQWEKLDLQESVVHQATKGTKEIVEQLEKSVSLEKQVKKEKQEKQELMVIKEELVAPVSVANEVHKDLQVEQELKEILVSLVPLDLSVLLDSLETKEMLELTE